MKSRRIPISALESPIVKLIAGSEGRVFTVHKDIICLHSSFFNGAFNHDFEESSKLSFTFQEDKPDLVEAMIQWMYGGEVSIETIPITVRERERVVAWHGREKDSNFQSQQSAVQRRAPKNSPEKAGHYQAIFAITAQFWVPADLRGVPDLQHEIINHLYSLTKEHLDMHCASSVRKAVRLTPDGSHLWNFLAEYFVVVVGFHHLSDNADFPNGFLMLCGKRLFAINLPPQDRKGRTEYWASLDMCRFHSHKESERCQS